MPPASSFRTFATNLTPVKRKLEALGTGVEQPPSRETYIVTRLNIESNVKIRGKHLQVKGLKARLQMLEQWEPIFSKKFPVSSEDAENSVFPPLGLEVDLDEETEARRGGFARYRCRAAGAGDDRGRQAPHAL